MLINSCLIKVIDEISVVSLIYWEIIICFVYLLWMPLILQFCILYIHWVGCGNRSNVSETWTWRQIVRGKNSATDACSGWEFVSVLFWFWHILASYLGEEAFVSEPREQQIKSSGRFLAGIVAQILVPKWFLREIKNPTRSAKGGRCPFSGISRGPGGRTGH